jgi:hypothetical protein
LVGSHLKHVEVAVLTSNITVLLHPGSTNVAAAPMQKVNACIDSRWLVASRIALHSLCTALHAISAAHHLCITSALSAAVIAVVNPLLPACPTCCEKALAQVAGHADCEHIETESSTHMSYLLLLLMYTPVPSSTPATAAEPAAAPAAALPAHFGSPVHPASQVCGVLHEPHHIWCAEESGPRNTSCCGLQQPESVKKIAGHTDSNDNATKGIGTASAGACIGTPMVLLMAALPLPELLVSRLAGGAAPPASAHRLGAALRALLTCPTELSPIAADCLCSYSCPVDARNKGATATTCHALQITQ